MDFMNPLERFIFRISGINPNESMNWKQFLKAMLTINLLMVSICHVHADLPG